MPLTPAIAAALDRASTATITTVLLKKGVRRTWMRGPMPLASAAGKRVIGPAFTLRFVPAREDLATPESWSSPTLDARRDRGDAGGRRRRRRCDGRARRGRVRRHPLRAHAASAASPRSSPTAWCAISRALWRPACRSGARAEPRRRRSQALPSSAGRSRSDAAAWRSSPTTSSSRTATAPWSFRRHFSPKSPPEAEEQERLEAWIMGEVEKGAALPGTLSAERRDEGEVREGAQIAGQPLTPGFGSASPN